jgi:hypothetical protein
MLTLYRFSHDSFVFHFIKSVLIALYTSQFCRVKLDQTQILKWYQSLLLHTLDYLLIAINFPLTGHAPDVLGVLRAREIASNCEGMTIGGLGLPEEGNSSAGSGVRRSGVTCHHVLVM